MAAITPSCSSSTRRLPSRCLEIELHDHETEHGVVDDRVRGTDNEDEPGLFMVMAEEVQTPVENPAEKVKPSLIPEQVADHERESGEDRVHQEERRRNEDERELDPAR